MRTIHALLFLLVFPACAQPRVDGTRLLDTVAFLSDDALQGRATGTAGAAAAAAFIRDGYEMAGLVPFASSEGRAYDHPFSDQSGAGVNVIGFVTGTKLPERFIVITAHYDHLGIRAGEIYNGADDNASGVAGLLELARWFVANPARHSLVFAALDAEESGLRGARAFLADAPVATESIVLNVNLDMIGHSEPGELVAAGTGHYPQLKPLLIPVAERSRVQLLFGHDSQALGRDDWTMASDHGPFHQAGIPFIYFGVKDHEDYHRPTDDLERLTPAFFVEAVETILKAVEALDRGLQQ